MAERRIVYLVILIGSVVFFWAYREWLSWILLLIAVFLPWLSLVVSLPAMLLMRVAVQCTDSVTAGTQTPAKLIGIGKLPLPPIKGKLSMEQTLTGCRQRLKGNFMVPTEHCGMILLTPRRVWVYDYLGLFRLPALRRQGSRLMVLPVQIPQHADLDLSRYLANAWKPKPGGGFSENHELRLYRPGDNLRQLHWKLSAKTGQLILREPMEAVRGMALLTMELSGTPEELDRKLGRLYWLSEHLLNRGIPHQVDCLTGGGLESFSLHHSTDIRDMLQQLLCAQVTDQAAFDGYTQASWSYHIGGEANES